MTPCAGVTPPLDKLAAAAVQCGVGACCDIDISLLNVIKWAFSSIYLGSGQTGAGYWGACWGHCAKTSAVKRSIGFTIVFHKGLLLVERAY